MAAKRSSSSPLKTARNDTHGNSLKNSTNSSFRIQSAPPLSLQHHARSLATLPGSQIWRPSGAFRQPHFHAYLSPEKRQQPEAPSVQPWIHTYRRKYSIPTYTLENYKQTKPKPVEPVWHHPGKFKERPPTSLSPEKIVKKSVNEPVWRPAGKSVYKPVPYFDPPNLRWSIQDLRKSLGDLSTKTMNTSRSTSVNKS
ncbi:unnamed protein product [Rotaria socialis]|uniref:Uncharacterized protein n=1 Tax=Rotaria socialis TaxID=392032 RepID=A0A818I8V4_9BILA|nr:unnamed protein product [Rotaria socialis]CAF3390725.1 unnamed protein product [Rotaria socialis]CAF3466458.1 unnamed protein product [Rotaria socialis]CAF3516872.1 unnamed protein product [Rotaria socialis]CAF4108209.1 unnamed protein product [Rotaria socialis]